MLIFEQILSTGKEANIYLKNNRKTLLILSVTAEQRNRTRHRFQSDEGQDIFLKLSRGIYLNDGDLLQAQTGELLIINPKPEPVLTITSDNYLQLMKAAYHLGNRHAAVEINQNYLRISPDAVLAKMITDLGLQICQETVPFYPESGAYKH